MNKIICALVCISTAAFATADDAKKTAATTSYRTAMKRGRDAYGRNDYAGAITAFSAAADAAQQANTATGTDHGNWSAAAYSEMGLAAYRQKDLKAAEKYTRAALGATFFTPTLPIVASTYFNLGRILEDKGDTRGAALAYAKSIAIRPNAIATAQLAKIDPDAALPPVQPRPMLGPFPSVAAFCKDARRLSCLLDMLQDGDNTARCQSEKSAGTLKNPPAPYLAVQIVSTACLFNTRESYGSHAHRLAIQTSAGWFVSQEIATTFTNRHCDDDIQVKITPRDLVVGGAPELIVDLSTGGDCAGGGSDNEFGSQALMVAGIGPSGKPSATLGLALSHWLESGSDSDEDVPKKSESVKLNHRFVDGGKLEITGGKGKLSRLVGTHTLVFP